jgi:hypothetical protein
MMNATNATMISDLWSMTDSELDYQFDCAELHDDEEMMSEIECIWAEREAGFNGPQFRDH